MDDFTIESTYKNDFKSPGLKISSMVFKIFPCCTQSTKTQ